MFSCAAIFVTHLPCFIGSIPERAAYMLVIRICSLFTLSFLSSYCVLCHMWVYSFVHISASADCALLSSVRFICRHFCGFSIYMVLLCDLFVAARVSMCFCPTFLL